MSGRRDLHTRSHPEEGGAWLKCQQRQPQRSGFVLIELSKLRAGVSLGLWVGAVVRVAGGVRVMFMDGVVDVDGVGVGGGVWIWAGAGIRVGGWVAIGGAQTRVVVGVRVRVLGGVGCGVRVNVVGRVRGRVWGGGLGLGWGWMWSCGCVQSCVWGLCCSCGLGFGLLVGLSVVLVVVGRGERFVGEVGVRVWVAEGLENPPLTQWCHLMEPSTDEAFSSFRPPVCPLQAQLPSMWLESGSEGCRVFDEL